MTSLEGQVALVTGSSRGIGAALATTADLTSFDQIEAMRRQIEDHGGPAPAHRPPIPQPRPCRVAHQGRRRRFGARLASR
jgi:hypothetical protein